MWGPEDGSLEATYHTGRLTLVRRILHWLDTTELEWDGAEALLPKAEARLQAPGRSLETPD